MAIPQAFSRGRFSIRIHKYRKISLHENGKVCDDEYDGRKVRTPPFCLQGRKIDYTSLNIFYRGCLTDNCKRIHHSISAEAKQSKFFTNKLWVSLTRYKSLHGVY